MEYSFIADTYEQIEATTKRLEMTGYLMGLIQNTPKDLIRKVAYLTRGTLKPDFMGIEIGIAEKLAIESITRVTGIQREKVTRNLKTFGDLGSTIERLLSESRARKSSIDSFLPAKRLTVEKVYETLEKIANTSGKGSVETKVSLLSQLLREASSKEAKYLIRTVTGKLRLGIGDMTFLDALAITYGGGKEAREAVERAYNVSSDIGLVSEVLAEEGLRGLKTFSIKIGRPVRPMLCERLTSAEKILEKLKGTGSAEYKYDGLRIQAHISPSGTFLFSRKLENITLQFPDLLEALGTTITAKKAVVEGECVAVDPDTGEIQPFQVVTQRRGRKYNILKKIKEVPVILVLFDLLYVNGETITESPYFERRKKLEQIVSESEIVMLTHPIIANSPHELDQHMDKAIEEGYEGLVVKSVGTESIYQAGSRGFLWIKYKRDYMSELVDTLDLVAVAAFAGRGKRAGTYGALLMASYDDESDMFRTVCKLGTGFDDETLAKLPKLFAPYLIDHSHSRVDSKIDADYWFVPVKVLEILGAELTLSPSHTCALGVVKKDSGLAVRFPRFTGKWRENKAPEDATTVKEIVAMYRSQLKQVK